MAATREDVENAVSQLAVFGLYISACVMLVVGYATMSLGSIVGSVTIFVCATFLVICAQAIETNGYSRALLKVLPPFEFNNPPLDERKFSDGEPVWGDAK